MMLSIITAINKILDRKFKSMLRNGYFPEVHYEEYPGGHSCYMFEYSDTHAAFAKVVDKQMKEKLDPRLGVFTRKHSTSFLAEVEKIVENVTDVDVYATMPERFHSFADSVRDYATNNL
jgi:hypothetical protein